MTSMSDAPAGAYSLRISRLTVDKLGVKLYDKVSAVVAELVANGYDADATDVIVELPLGTSLTVADGNGTGYRDNDYKVIVRDNGHGMTPVEAQRDYLQVGRDRRIHADQGARSREQGRPVMGRKGIGKLAPFGICHLIEVMSSGGVRSAEGYVTSHFFLDFNAIVSEDNDAAVPLAVGDQDGTYSQERGTTITLSGFQPKRVPVKDVFMRQLARRFALTQGDFRVSVLDLRTDNSEEMPAFSVISSSAACGWVCCGTRIRRSPMSPALAGVIGSVTARWPAPRSRTRMPSSASVAVR